MTGTFHDTMGSSRGVGIITAHDTNELTNYSQAIRVTVAGIVKVTTYNDEAVSINFLAGETRYLIVKKIWSTGTDAAVKAGVIEAMY